MAEDNIVQTALAAGKLIATQDATPTRIGDDGVPFLVLTDGGVRVQNVEEFLAQPSRKRAAVGVRDAASFIRYIERFKEDSTVIFANVKEKHLTGVIDYHGESGEDANWGQHHVKLTCHLTDDWNRWAGSNKRQMSQEEFAEFLENNLHNIADPPGGVILDMATTLIAKKDVDFSSAIRLSNGQHQLRYEETISSKAGEKGDLSIPERFKLGISPFEGSPLYEVMARFRYRINERVLKLSYDMLRADAVLEDAFNNIRAEIEDKVSVPIFSGSMPAIPVK